MSIGVLSEANAIYKIMLGDPDKKWSPEDLAILYFKDKGYTGFTKNLLNELKRQKKIKSTDRGRGYRFRVVNSDQSSENL